MTMSSAAAAAAAALVVLLVLSSAVEAWKERDLVVRLPGQPKVDFKQYAGYVDVDEKTGKSLFYYFVEAQHHPLHKPLTLWLNGGPGCSSVGGGAFTELGPFFPRGDGRGLIINKHSWNKVSNFLFIESPAGVGWSYSNTSSDYTTGDAQTASDMHMFLMRWFDKFPEYKGRDFYLTGESYAGHYIPQLAALLLEHNAHAKSTDMKFNLKGVAIGNPLLKLLHDAPAVYEYYWSHGMISDELGLTIMQQCDFNDYTFDDAHNVSLECIVATKMADIIVGEYIDNYDVILDVCYTSLVEQELRLKKYATKKSINVDVCMSYERRFYFNLPEVQRALHANRTSLSYPWRMCSDFVDYARVDGNIDILPVLEGIVKSGVPVWVYSGDQDSVVPLIGSRTNVKDLARYLGFNITLPYTAWFDHKQVGGWTTEYGNMLTFATVRGASHMVPYAQPARSLQLFKSFIHGKRLPTTPPK